MMYSLEIVCGTDLLTAFFRSGMNCTLMALTLNTCDYTTRFSQATSARYFTGRSRRLAPTVSPRTNSTAPHFTLRLRSLLPTYCDEVIFMAALHLVGVHRHGAGYIENSPRFQLSDLSACQPFYAFNIAAVMYLMISFVLIKFFKGGKAMDTPCQTAITHVRIRYVYARNQIIEPGAAQTLWRP